MSKSNLKYFVELEPGNKNYRTYVDVDRQHSTRIELAYHKGDVFMVCGAQFRAKQVIAEPAKKSTLPEVLLSLLITIISLYFIKGEYIFGAMYPKSYLLLPLVVALVGGFVVGQIRIAFQMADADYFNKS